MIASNEIPVNRRVDFDTTVTAMALTAKEMNSKYKETSEGGLAVSLALLLSRALSPARDEPSRLISAAALAWLVISLVLLLSICPAARRRP